MGRNSIKNRKARILLTNLTANAYMVRVEFKKKRNGIPLERHFRLTPNTDYVYEIRGEEENPQSSQNAANLKNGFKTVIGRPVSPADKAKADQDLIYDIVLISRTVRPQNNAQGYSQNPTQPQSQPTQPQSQPQQPQYSNPTPQGGNSQSAVSNIPVPNQQNPQPIPGSNNTLNNSNTQPIVTNPSHPSRGCRRTPWQGPSPTDNPLRRAISRWYNMFPPPTLPPHNPRTQIRAEHRAQPRSHNPKTSRLPPSALRTVPCSQPVAEMETVTVRSQWDLPSRRIPPSEGTSLPIIPPYAPHPHLHAPPVRAILRTGTADSAPITQPFARP